MKAQLKRQFPRTWQTARTARQGLALVRRLFGHRPRECPICGFEGKFLAEIHFPDIFTFDAMCPQCGSLPRSRLLVIAVKERGLIGAEDRVLHFAPEGPVRDFVHARAKAYVTADLDPRGVDRQENIEALSFPDAQWSVIICSHVLEHVDHRQALRELSRVLAPGGALLALIPIVEGWEGNYENSSVSTPGDRAIHFGKDNHLRRFGRAVEQDFRAAGLVLERFSPGGADAVRYGLIPGETLFIARKPA